MIPFTRIMSLLMAAVLCFMLLLPLALRQHNTMLAVGIVVVLGVVFYGLDSSSINQAGSSKTELTTAQNSTTQKQNSTAQNNTQPPAAPPGMRDVTPRANTEPGVTTGSASTRPPPSSPNQSDATQGANPFNHSEQR